MNNHHRSGQEAEPLLERSGRSCRPNSPSVKYLASSPMSEDPDSRAPSSWRLDGAHPTGYYRAPSLTDYTATELANGTMQSSAAARDGTRRGTIMSSYTVQYMVHASQARTTGGLGARQIAIFSNVDTTGRSRARCQAAAARAAIEHCPRPRSTTRPDFTSSPVLVIDVVSLTIDI